MSGFLGSALSSVSNSALNPFNYLGSGIQSIIPGQLGVGISDALSLGGPGAILGGVLGGKTGALIGGGLGSAAGLGANGWFPGSMTSNPTSGGLFGSGGFMSGLGSGPTAPGGAAGGGGMFGGGGGMFGGGDLASILAGGIPLAFLTNEADRLNKVPTGFSTPYSSVKGGVATLDPSYRANTLANMDQIRGLQSSLGDTLGAQRAGMSSAIGGFGQALSSLQSNDPQGRQGLVDAMGNFRNLIGQAQNADPTGRNAMVDSLSNYRRMLTDASGNQNPYIQARVRPLEEQFGRRRGELMRSLGQRGVMGSSFGDQSLNSFGIDSERALGDARSQATQEALTLQQQLNQLLGSGGGALRQSDMDMLLGQGQLNQGLAGVGSQLRSGDQNLSQAMASIAQGQAGAQADMWQMENQSAQLQASLNQLLQSGNQDLLQSELAGLGLGNMEIANLLQRAQMRTDMFGRAAAGFGNLLTGA